MWWERGTGFYGVVRTVRAMLRCDPETRFACGGGYRAACGGE